MVPTGTRVPDATFPGVCQVFLESTWDQAGLLIGHWRSDIALAAASPPAICIKHL